MKGSICLAAALLLLAGCVTEEPERRIFSEEESEEVAAFNLKLAERFWERDRKDLAFRYLEMAARQEPEAAAPRLKIVDLYLLNQNPAAALRYLDACPVELQQSPAFVKRRAVALAMGNCEEEAAEILDSALAQGSVDAHIIALAAEDRLLRGMPEEAYAMLTEAHLRDPQERGYLELLVDLCRATSRYEEEAKYRMKLACNLTGEPEHLRAAGRAFMRAGLMDRGIEEISELLDIALPSDRPFIEACLASLYCRKGDFGIAALLFERAFTNPDFSPDGDEILAFAEASMRNDEHESAIPLLERALLGTPDFSLARAALAWAYHCTGKTELSRRVLAEAPSECAHDELLINMKRKLDGRAHEDS